MLMTVIVSTSLLFLSLLSMQEHTSVHCFEQMHLRFLLYYIFGLFVNVLTICLQGVVQRI